MLRIDATVSSPTRIRTPSPRDPEPAAPAPPQIWIDRFATASAASLTASGSVG
jgi:hypothetical protein